MNILLLLFQLGGKGVFCFLSYNNYLLLFQLKERNHYLIIIISSGGGGGVWILVL